MNDLIYLKRCANLIEDKLGWGSKDNWSHKDFLKLSEMVRAASHISISTDTLKRVFGKVKAARETYNPQVETKNAFAIFLGYHDWYEFREKQKPYVEGREKSGKEMSPVTTHPVEERVKKPLEKTYLLILIVVVLLASVIYAFTKREQSPKVIFQCREPVGLAPHTAIFTYDISHAGQDTVFIDYDWEYPKLETIAKNDSIATTYHAKPGYYHVKLRNRDQILASQGVHVLSEGWQGYIKYNGKEQRLKSGATHNGELYLSDSEYEKYGIKPDTELRLNYFNFQKFRADGDHFTLQSRIKNSEETGGITCFDTKFMVICEHSFIEISLLEKGCAKFARFYVSEIQLNGHNKDLTPLGIDLSDWRKVEISVVNKTLVLTIDGQPIYTKKYSQALGSIKGLIINFKGRGKMDYLKIFNEKNQVVYDEPF